MIGWTVVWSGRTLAEATLVRNELDARGLDPRIRGDGRPQLLGEIPFVDAQVDVCVSPERAAAARIVLWTFALSEGGDDWPCTCGETNPGTFETCWSCGRAR